jgi:hypothetical protein
LADIFCFFLKKFVETYLNKKPSRKNFAEIIFAYKKVQTLFAEKMSCRNLICPKAFAESVHNPFLNL